MGQAAGKRSGRAKVDKLEKLLLEEEPVARDSAFKRRSKKRAVTKLILLGSGNSGKSTVFKQFQLMHNKGFSEAEKQFYRAMMPKSTIAAIKRLLQNANDLLFEGLIGDNAVDEKSFLAALKGRRETGEEKMDGENGGDEASLASYLKSAKDDMSDLKGKERASDLRSNYVDIEARSMASSSRSRSSLGKSRFSTSRDSNLERGTGSLEQNVKPGSRVISENLANIATFVASLPDDTPLEQRCVVEDDERTYTVAEMLKLIWEDPVVQFVYSLENKYPSLEYPIGYYMQEIARISSKDFAPTDQDILYARRQTRKVQEMRFSVDGKDFELVDIGGQRIERRRWVNHFENVDAVIFVVGLDGYNQICLEDGRANRMREALDLFKDVSSSPYFTSTNFLLFLNKSDIFLEKVQTVPLTVCFKSYSGDPHNFDQCTEYIRKRFVETHMRCFIGKTMENRKLETLAMPKVYSHVTCSVDPKQMQFVIGACQSICLRRAIASTLT